MNADLVNKEALTALNRQDWRKAQDLFYKNSRSAPSYQTYNNLGFFLITEGLECKNGKTINALKLGIKYLNRSSEIQTTLTNEKAKIEAICYLLRDPKEDHVKLYEKALEHLKTALNLGYSRELHHNYLSFNYLLKSDPSEILSESRELAELYPCNETVSLYLELLRVSGSYNEGLKLIERHDDLIDADELLMFHVSCRFFEKGAELCEKARKEYAFDKIIASAILECYVNTKQFDKAKDYAKELLESTKERSFGNKKSDVLPLIEDLLPNSPYRMKMIESYRLFPTLIHQCGYFGCERHGSPW